MSKKKKILPQLEIIIILIFFLFFLVWAVPKCSQKKSELKEADTPIENSGDSLQGSASGDALIPPPQNNTKPENNTAATETANYAPLYITIDNWTLRTGPSLDSTAIQKLPLFEEVYFLNKVTDFKEVINLGKAEANEPWIKIRTKKGREGWVYGAGVNYYKKKNEDAF